MKKIAVRRSPEISRRLEEAKTVLHNMIRGVVLLLVLLAAGLAAGQSLPGLFQSPDNRWLHSNGTTGLLYGGGSTIVVDRNGNGVVGGADTSDPTYTLPAEARQANNYFLSPTREFLYVAGGTSVGGCQGLTIRLFRLPYPVSVPVLLHADCLPCGVPFNGGMAQWYDGGLAQSTPYSTGVSSQRLAFIVTATALCGSANASPELRVYDLMRPVPAGRAVVTLSPGWERFTVSQSGTHALIKHDLTLDPTNADYTLVDLCPEDFGTSRRVVDDGRGETAARIVDVSASQLTVEVVDDGAVVWSGQFADCLASSGPPIGACCVNGVCSQSVQAACTGAWTAGVSCTTNPCPPPPAPILSVHLTGPIAAMEADEVTYTLTYQNTGNATASNVVIENQMPDWLTFVRASNSGFRNGLNAVVWNLGSLPAGSGLRTVTWTGRVPCGAPSPQVNSVSRIRASNFVQVLGTGSVSTTVTPIFTAPVTVTIVSTPARAPLLPTDTVEHAIRLVNTGAQTISGIVIGGLSPGDYADMESAAAGGGLVVTPFFPSGAGISGDLGPGQTVDITIVTRMHSCFPWNAGRWSFNRGQQVAVFDRCNRRLGFAIPAGFDLQRPLSASVLVANISSATAGAAVEGRASDGHRMMKQIVRTGVPLTIALTLSNTSGDGPVTISAGAMIPAGLMVGSPALLDPIPTGAAWDSGTRRLEFSGVLGVSESVTIRLNVSAPPGAGESQITLEGDAGGCQALRESLRLLPILAPPPSEPYATGVGTQTGLWYNSLASDAGPTEWISAPSERWRSISRDPDGYMYLIGEGAIRFHPDTLDTQDVGNAISSQLIAGGLGNWFFNCGAWDTATQTLMVMGSDYYVSRGYLARYDPATGITTLLASDPILTYANGLAVDAGGRPYVPFGNSLWTADLTLPLPRPDNTGTLIPVAPAFTFGNMLGAPASSSATHVSSTRDGEAMATVRSIFDASQPGRTTLWYVDSLLSMDGGGIATLHDIIAAYATDSLGSPPTLPPGVTPAIGPGSVLATPFAASAGGEALGVTTPGVNSAPRGLAHLPQGTVLQHDAAVNVDMHSMILVGALTPRCPADFNGDGGVDGGDVDAFFVSWEAGDPSADVNFDGGVDGGDVDTFFVAWEAGGCT